MAASGGTAHGWGLGETDSFLACWNNAGVQTPILGHVSRDALGAPIVTFTDLVGAAITPVAANVFPGECPQQLITEQYILDGALPVGAAAPYVGVDAGGSGAVGNTVTIVAPYKAIGWRFRRSTGDDTADDGVIGQLLVNGVAYNPGKGDVYTEDGWTYESNDSEFHVDPVVFTVTGDASIVLLVQRAVGNVNANQFTP